ncbi:BLOC-1-related complex subunit 8 homolog isoform X2 [Neodiprion pinetum]|uniref:BLOC-1-related complex subunit 8 homolog isoform X2 n=1 Tax=Neodiprion lecontei TaxID=441921 RepID=A0A6J0B800_NEOLC|nr:BLOC-1-related complex subunit 8 homolog isoform X2 [Neodiprion lecontei]XP_046428510.1 BLOC-1-related complex subunit 8 homolog isoform X2 [Neodiprion fabricii]XP_046485566.1 BLOC-1-related complex subunit 8 homolog isoform X2 [Neodiprion pinetum]XP_046618490.1 BLOC-1-related complex subunit 8 homolog isoform X2 [Neodiprion virginianus]
MAKVYLPDQELETKVKKATERISENMHIVANEPSLAFYRLQEHVRKALPPMVERRVEVLVLQQQLQGRCYDAEYAQLKYQEQRRLKKDGSKDSVYKRLSAHIPTLEHLPDEISDVVRETANKVESMMNHARHSTDAQKNSN